MESYCEKRDRQMTVTLDQPIPKTTDQMVMIQGNWARYKLIQQDCEQSPGIRVFYFDGAIEILMPGRLHEIFSDLLHVLLSLYLLHSGLDFLGMGSADQEAEGIAAVQPDRSYCIEGVKPIPDLAIEVVFSSGEIDKLARYQAIGVPEVWFWQDGLLSLYHLRSNGYEAIDRSELPGLKDLDLEVFQRCLLMGETSTAAAMQEFNAYLQNS
ncbi:MAG: Uma2 family endonuclease [Synechococcales bacterium]|nr:Uma2 family endonuclease [Synechococcales bacterium]